VGFLDGSRIIQVSAYVSLTEMWREWGRSFDLKDATPAWRRWVDVARVWSAQALPLPMLVGLAALLAGPGSLTADRSHAMLLEALVLVNASALFVRMMLLVALRGSYAERGWPFWLSWLSDIAAAWRLTLSTARTPTRWRGRQYDTMLTDGAN
jgi:dolichol-phosphate mannosyltransferase